MQFLRHLRPHLILFSRVAMWAAIGIFVMVGLFQSVPAWALPTACPGEDAPSNSTIPINSTILFLRYTGPASTYEVYLCDDPASPVEVASSITPSDKIVVDPTEFTLTSNVTQTVSVTVAAGQPAEEPFTATITHLSASDDSSFEPGTLNVDFVTVHYLPPMAVGDAASTLPEQSVDINVLANDIGRLAEYASFGFTGALTLIAEPIVTAPEHGTATRVDDSTIRYTPQAGFDGADTFTYQIVDELGNTGTAAVIVVVTPANVQNPQIQEAAPEGDELIFTTSAGDVIVTTPVINGVPDGGKVHCVFGLLADTSGNENTFPLPGRFSGLGFYFQCYVNDEPVESEQLEAPVTLQVPLSDAIRQLGGRYVVGGVDDDDWTTDGIDTDGGPVNGSLRVQITRQGEFALFVQHVIALPFLERHE